VLVQKNLAIYVPIVGLGSPNVASTTPPAFRKNTPIVSAARIDLDHH